MRKLKSYSEFSGSTKAHIKTFEQFELDWSETDDLFIADIKDQYIQGAEEEEKEDTEDQDDVEGSESDI